MIDTEIFNIQSPQQFKNIALKIFKYQAQNNEVYKRYLSLLKVNPSEITELTQIPFLPISFFKYHKIITGSHKITQAVFKSSGTSTSVRSHHFVTDLKLYENSFINGFNHFFGDFSGYCFLALLPSYLEQGNSSLVYMINHFIKHSRCKDSGFYLYDFEKLKNKIEKLTTEGKKTILFGVSYALMDFAGYCNFSSTDNLYVFETGGMKGRRKELPKEELHAILKKGFGVNTIFSEYGMTELLSQAYSKGQGLYSPVPWMKVLIRDRYDPFSYLPPGRIGGINIIDLANINSCSFIETEDLGRKHPNGQFEILGRFDTVDIRGCNLMIGE